MGFWAGIKHALNSTLGTSEFKPLNEYIRDLIIGQKRLVASDDVLAVILNEEYYGDNEYYRRLGTFTPTVSGNVRLYFEARGTFTSLGRNNGEVAVYVNGNVRARVNVNPVDGVDATDDYQKYSIDFNVTQNELCSVEYLKGDGANSRIKVVQIRGSVVDSYTYDYTVDYK